MMTDDDFLIKCLNNYLANVKEEYDFAKQFTDEDSMEIAEDNIEIYDILKVVLEDISSIESLNELDDDDYLFVYECLQAYAESFVIDGRDNKLKEQGEQDYNRLMALIHELEADFNYDSDEDE